MLNLLFLNNYLFDNSKIQLLCDEAFSERFFLVHSGKQPEIKTKTLNTHFLSSLFEFFSYAATSFIRLRADPALNQVICCSLNVWLRVMSSWVPSLCLRVATTG